MPDAPPPMDLQDDPEPTLVVIGRATLVVLLAFVAALALYAVAMTVAADRPRCTCERCK